MENKKTKVGGTGFYDRPAKLKDYKVLLHINYVIPVHCSASNENAACRWAMDEYGEGHIQIEDSISHVDHSETFEVKSVEEE